MAKTVNIALSNFTQANLDAFGTALLFASDVDVYINGTARALSITSNVESNYGDVVADDSASEFAIDVRTGKAVKGNRVVGRTTLANIQSDISDYVAYQIARDGTEYLYTGTVSSTQSQDYTPAFLSGPHIMLTPEQVQSLGL